MYKYILWDWNGTLISDIDPVIRAMNKILTKRKLPLLTEETYKEIFDFPVRKYYEKLGFDFSKDSFEELSDAFISNYSLESKNSKMVEHSFEVLTYLQEHGFKQCVLSASELGVLQSQVDAFQIGHFFQELIALDNIFADGKIHIGCKWMERSNVDKKEVLMIGDTTHDFEVTRAMGCDCIIFAGGHQDRKRLDQLGVPVIDSLKEVLHYIK